MTSVKKDVSPTLMLFLKVSVCGGFTTFSTFSLETLTLFEEGKFPSESFSLCSAFFAVF
ncbi:CrcB family protein [Anaerovoracaceae bacterium 41-7]|jgi:CrcB protein|uniref:Fluoride-specific ion channel n=1 Tax=Anaerotruncus colihominis TaxID=169435 RepID=A0A845QHN4_9FIRM|nr:MULTISPECIES: CrcB family protein [Clostridia]MCI9476790.1 CrcB family protein [Emergencia sp.]MCI9639684.1 CrcB family protein [Emergencia sp.]NBH60187.1 CrcB family protein [Anaerotruncus colihominis]NCF00118.1 CrcB family protein [Emergencia sp. 1XD21-10]NCF00841.1 CrcB family protein [Anaerotruncus sp. 80]